MATRRYEINEGEKFSEVTEAVGAAVATKTVELTIDLADGMDQDSVLIAIDNLKQFIIQESNWPPA